MQGIRQTSSRLKRLFLGGFIVYLFGVIGILAPTHRHAGGSTNHSHPDCQLCQVSSEAYLAPVAMVCLDASFTFQHLVELQQTPFLSARYQPFSSRGPPSV